MTEYIGNNVVVIEGEGGAGKTTVAQIVSREYGSSNFNTGTLFRATAAGMILEQVRHEEIGDYVQTADYQVSTSDPRQPYVAVRGEDVSDLLQTPEVTRVASFIGQVAAASEKLEGIFNAQVIANRRPMVIEGKNLAGRLELLGIKPSYMFFLRAEQQVRAFRKWKQAQEKGLVGYTRLEAQFDTAQNDIRDKKLLIAPANTKVIDTTLLTAEQVARMIARAAGL